MCNRVLIALGTLQCGKKRIKVKVRFDETANGNKGPNGTISVLETAVIGIFRIREYILSAAVNHSRPYTFQYVMQMKTNLTSQRALRRQARLGNSSPSIPNLPTTDIEKKKEEYTVELTLYIDGVAYEYECLCQFCGIQKAEFHCTKCAEFHCSSCDATFHSFGKRFQHTRSPLSKRNLLEASLMITRCIRFSGHLKRLQRKCREFFRRYYDSKAMKHYYFNSIYKTSSWRKPYCLRRLELCPFLTTEQAAGRIKGLYYMWKARIRAYNLIKEQYSKLFDRNRQLYYYSHNKKVVPSHTLFLPRQSWKKPRLLYRRGYPPDIAIHFTPDIAAMKIQQKWRYCLVRGCNIKHTIVAL